jgi:hypothetical protein
MVRVMSTGGGLAELLWMDIVVTEVRQVEERPHHGDPARPTWEAECIGV